MFWRLPPVHNPQLFQSILKVYTHPQWKYGLFLIKKRYILEPVDFTGSKCSRDFFQLKNCNFSRTSWTPLGNHNWNTGFFWLKTGISLNRLILPVHNVLEISSGWQTTTFPKHSERLWAIPFAQSRFSFLKIRNFDFDRLVRFSYKSVHLFLFVIWKLGLLPTNCARFEPEKKVCSRDICRFVNQDPKFLNRLKRHLAGLIMGSFWSLVKTYYNCKILLKSDNICEKFTVKYEFIFSMKEK